MRLKTGVAAQAEQVVPTLVELLQDAELYPRSSAVGALSRFGARAKAAVPALVQYATKAGNKSERDEGIKALAQVNPDALSKAGLQ